MNSFEEVLSKQQIISPKNQPPFWGYPFTNLYYQIPTPGQEGENILSIEDTKV